MRQVVSRYASQSKPATIKKRVAQTLPFSAPLEGMSLSSKMSTSDRAVAPILDNFNVLENKIECRSGYRLVHDMGDGAPIKTLIPWYGDPSKFAAASAGSIRNGVSGALIEDGFGSDDWAWTSFSNLGEADFTILVNGVDGVQSWDGTTIVVETVTAPTAEPWIDPLKFDKVLSHINRLWFADSQNLAVYYLPLQQKTGELKLLPLNVLFRRGGFIQAIATWTIDGGDGVNDRLVIFSSNGECVIYSGVDPDTDFQLVGIFRFDSPLSHTSVQNYGGDLYILSGTGVLPLSTVMKVETEEFGESDTDVYSEFNTVGTLYRNNPGWQLGIDHSTGRFIANMPLGAPNKYQQMIRFMPKPVWARWRDIPSRYWLWIEHRLYFGDDSGRVYEMDSTIRSDNGSAITIDVQWAWSAYKSAGIKHFKMLKPFILTDGEPVISLEMRVDYDQSVLRVVPDGITTTDLASAWDVSLWDETFWGGSPKSRSRWEGAAAIGDVGAPRLTARVLNCYFAINGIHVLFEAGSVFG